MKHETKLQIQAALAKRGWTHAAQVINEFVEALESIDEQKKLRADAERRRYWLREHGWSGYFDDGLTNSESDADIIAAIDKERES